MLKSEEMEQFFLNSETILNTIYSVNNEKWLITILNNVLWFIKLKGSCLKIIFKFEEICFISSFVIVFNILR